MVARFDERGEVEVVAGSHVYSGADDLFIEWEDIDRTKIPAIENLVADIRHKLNELRGVLLTAGK